jgi:hypothetical protein
MTQVLEQLQEEVEEHHPISTKQELIETWSELVKNSEPNSLQHLQYLILRGLTCKVVPSEEEMLDRLMKSFTPVSNKVKIENGHAPYQTLFYGLMDVKYSKCHMDISSELREGLRIAATNMIPMMNRFGKR